DREVWLSRLAHNQENAGSIPAPATNNSKRGKRKQKERQEKANPQLAVTNYYSKHQALVRILIDNLPVDRIKEELGDIYQGLLKPITAQNAGDNIIATENE
ncbi:26594_t:CDS:2, partial [Racocetra persica]